MHTISYKKSNSVEKEEIEKNKIENKKKTISSIKKNLDSKKFQSKLNIQKKKIKMNIEIIGKKEDTLSHYKNRKDNSLKPSDLILKNFQTLDNILRKKKKNKKVILGEKNNKAFCLQNNTKSLLKQSKSDSNILIDSDSFLKRPEFRSNARQDAKDRETKYAEILEKELRKHKDQLVNLLESKKNIPSVKNLDQNANALNNTSIVKQKRAITDSLKSNKHMIKRNLKMTKSLSPSRVSNGSFFSSQSIQKEHFSRFPSGPHDSELKSDFSQKKPNVMIPSMKMERPNNIKNM